jgi:hypothetical protein
MLVGEAKLSCNEMVGKGMGFEQLGHVPMTRVVGTARAGDADHGTVQGVVGVACALDESFAQKQRKTAVPILGQSLFKTTGRLGCIHD